MQPISVTIDAKRSYMIHHQCIKCKTTIPTRAILDDEYQKDDFDLLIALSQQPLKRY